MWEGIQEVETGMVVVAQPPSKLRCSAIGSCVAVVMYDPIRKFGGIAHVMLPQAYGLVKAEDTLKYAEPAIDHLIGTLVGFGAKKRTMMVQLVGGGLIVEDALDIGKMNLEVVESKLRKENIPVVRRSVGGRDWRSILFDIESGVVRYRQGNQTEKFL